jgi:hypothetical protein
MKINLFAIVMFAAVISILYFVLFQESIKPVLVDKDAAIDISKVNRDSQVREPLRKQSEVTEEEHYDSSTQLNYGECYVYDKEKEAKLMQERKAYLQSLSESTNREEQLAYAVFAISNIFPDYNPDLVIEVQQKRIEALVALKQNDHPLVALETLRMCSIQTDFKHCDNALIEEITSLHKNDSEVWLEAINYYLETEQDEHVFRAINQAKQSKYSSSFYSLFVSTYAQTMAKANIGQYNSIVMNALGYYMAKGKPYRAQTDWCKNNLQNEKYAQGCLDMGVLMEQTSSDTIDKVIGLAIQGIIYETEGNAEMTSLVQKKQDVLSQPNSLDSTEANVLSTIFNYEKLLKTYIDNIETLGEYGALHQLKPEVLAFKESSHYEGCGNF